MLRLRLCMLIRSDAYSFECIGVYFIRRCRIALQEVFFYNSLSNQSERLQGKTLLGRSFLLSNLRG